MFGKYFTNPSEAYTLVDPEHILKIYLGNDIKLRKTMLLISSVKPPDFDSTKIIDVVTGFREDGLWTLIFSLKDPKFEDIFISFCEDLISGSKEYNSETEAVKFTCDRYKNWQFMLAKISENILSRSVIKGLIGEILFLKDKLIKNFGEDKALKAWVGPDGFPQDFILDDCWYEIKSVKISSIEQLDTENEGNLVILFFNETSPLDNRGINLYDLYFDMIGSLSLENADIFKQKILKLGFVPDLKYKDIKFELNKIDTFFVNEDFPIIRRKELDPVIENVEYSLIIKDLDKYKKESL